MTWQAAFVMAGMMLSAGAVAATTPASPASEPVEYSAAAFAAAHSQGRTIVVETYASWCLPCRLQSPILDHLRRQSEFSQIRVLRIGEKSPRSDWQRFSLTGYGTLIVLKGNREIARGNPVSEDAIADLLRTAR